jgi:hypothetical protein
VLGTLVLDAWLDPLHGKSALGPQEIAAMQKVAAVLAFYEQKIRPELLQSKIVPVLLVIGEKLPLIGRPATLPAW